MIGAAAAAAVAAAWFAPPAPEQIAAEISAPRAARAAETPARQAASFLSALPQRAGIGAGELFRAHIPPAPKAAAASAAPAAPVAPSNPYRFAGRVVQDGTARVFLSKGDRVHEVKAGEELEEGYRVESVSDQQVVLVYVPLGTKERVSIETSGLGADVPAAQQAPAPPSSRPKWWRERVHVRAEAQ